MNPGLKNGVVRPWLGLFLGLALSLGLASGVMGQAKPKLRVLLITGGCCHNYTFQSMALINATRKYADIDWTIALQGGYGTRGKSRIYEQAGWDKDYDLVIHNECFADTNEEGYVKGITSVHESGLPAIVIHCAMHTYRSADFDDWREFLGVTSRHHEHQSEYPTTIVAKDHPIMKDFPAQWVSPKDELYVIEKVWPNTTALATAKSERDGKEYPVFWVNQYGAARVFGTTFGHTDETFSDPDFLATLGRAILWTTSKDTRVP